jgi:hypothetical protein
MYAARAMVAQAKLIKIIFIHDSYCISETVAFLEKQNDDEYTVVSADAMMGAGR